MTITKEELNQKSGFIVPGMEFDVPSRHVQSGKYRVKVTSVTTKTKSSCWGSYEADIVHYETICQASKRRFVTKQRPDGTFYADEVWDLVPDKFYTNNECMSLASFIEYKYNKREVK